MANNNNYYGNSPLQRNVPQYNQGQPMQSQEQYNPSDWYGNVAPVKTKKVPVIIISLLIVVLLIVVGWIVTRGSSVSEKTPKGVVNKVIKAYKAKDIDMFFECFNKDCQEILNVAREEGGESYEQALFKNSSKADLDIINEKRISDEEYQFQIKITVDGKSNVDQLTVVKEDGEWKISQETQIR